MEAATAPQTPINVEEMEQVQAQTSEPTDETASSMFKYSEFVDVGAGAAECEHVKDRSESCGNTEHFHVWCRLPNPLQHEELRKKGGAAKAAKLRAFADPSSDDSIVLDQQLSQIADEAFKGQMVEELLQQEFADFYMEAQRDVEERDEFEFITQDRQEYTRISDEQLALDEDQRTDEFKRLQEHMTHYVETLRDALKERQEPRREELAARSVEDLVKMIRDRRVEDEADREFVRVYDLWMWTKCTYRSELDPSLGRPYRRRFVEPEEMYEESPEAIEALKATYNDLQIALQRASSGN